MYMYYLQEINHRDRRYLEVIGPGGEGNGRNRLMGTGFFMLNDRKVLKLDKGRCTTL